MKKIESQLYTFFSSQPAETELPPALAEQVKKNAAKRKRHWRAFALSAASLVLVLVVSLYAGLIVFAPANSKGEGHAPQYERVEYDASLSCGFAPAEWDYALTSSENGLLFALSDAPVPNFLYEVAEEGGEVWYFYKNGELVLSRWQTATLFAAISSAPVAGDEEYLAGEKIWISGVEVLENQNKYCFSYLSYDWYLDGAQIRGELEEFLKGGSV